MKGYFLLILIFMAALTGAMQSFADDLKQAVEIAAHGSKFQSERLKIAAENLANEDSTGATPGVQIRTDAKLFLLKISMIKNFEQM
jgi:flagellar basal body rod protein FlgC